MKSFKSAILRLRLHVQFNREIVASPFHHQVEGSSKIMAVWQRKVGIFQCWPALKSPSNPIFIWDLSAKASGSVKLLLVRLVGSILATKVRVSSLGKFP